MATERLTGLFKGTQDVSVPLMRGQDMVDFMARGADLLSEWDSQPELDIGT